LATLKGLTYLWLSANYSENPDMLGDFETKILAEGLSALT